MRKGDEDNSNNGMGRGGEPIELLRCLAVFPSGMTLGHETATPVVQRWRTSRRKYVVRHLAAHCGTFCVSYGEETRCPRGGDPHMKEARGYGGRTGTYTPACLLPLVLV